MLSNILKNRRLRMGSFATVLTVIFIAVLIILNMIVSAISERYPIQLDLTTGKIYGLSDETIEYLKTVEKDVNIYVLATEDSFGSPNEYYLQAAETIKKFPQYNSKIKVQFIDLAKDPAFPIPWAAGTSCWSAAIKSKSLKPATCLTCRTILAPAILTSNLPGQTRPLPRLS